MPTPDEYNKVLITKSNLPVSAAACLPFGKTGSFRAKGTRFQVGIRITAQLIASGAPFSWESKTPRSSVGIRSGTDGQIQEHSTGSDLKYQVARRGVFLWTKAKDRAFVFAILRKTTLGLSLFQRTKKAPSMLSKGETPDIATRYRRSKGAAVFSPERGNRFYPLCKSIRAKAPKKNRPLDFQRQGKNLLKVPATNGSGFIKRCGSTGPAAAPGRREGVNPI